MGIAKTGKFVLHLAQQGSKIYLTAYLAALMVRQMNKELVDVSKESLMKVLNAESLNLSHLNPRQISYEPKNIHTEAIQVTPENIGKLSLEFEQELVYDNQGRPYFFFSAQRFDSGLDVLDGSTELFVRMTDWIVPLRGELHVFRDDVFQNTFDFVERGLGIASETFAQGVLEFQKEAKHWADLKPLRDKLNVSKFQQNDRVHVLGTDMYGIATVIGIDMGDRVDGVDVLLDNTKQYHTFAPEELEHSVTEGPEGTQIIPKSE